MYRHLLLLLLLSQWSAITVVIVSAPVVGRVARTGLERILGSILGEPVTLLCYTSNNVFV